MTDTRSMRGYRYRLYPTPEQEAAMRRHVGVVRFVYNLALEQRREFGRLYKARTGKTLTFISQGRELNALVAEVDWIRAVPRVALEQALRDLDRAYANFFAGRSRYPRPRKRGANDTFRTAGRDTRHRGLNARWSEVWVAKVGWVRFRSTRPLPSRALNVTFSLEADKWFVSYACDVEGISSGATERVGIDRGVANTLALSTGELLSLPDTLETLQRRQRRAQRVLSRRQRGSRRREAQRRRVAAIRARARRIRLDWHHKVTASLAGRFGVVTLEALKVVHMTARGRGKRGLNRAILQQGWGQFERLLAYKLEAAGGRLVKASAAYTSQTCAECGVIDKRSRESQARFRCAHCGHEDNADLNAARNIRRAGSPLLDVEGGQRPPVEASTLASLSPKPASLGMPTTRSGKTTT